MLRRTMSREKWLRCLSSPATPEDAWLSKVLLLEKRSVVGLWDSVVLEEEETVGVVWILAHMEVLNIVNVAAVRGHAGS